MSPGDSYLRTGSVWLAFVTGENALDSQECFYNFSYSRLGNNKVDLSIYRLCFISSYIFVNPNRNHAIHVHTYSAVPICIFPVFAYATLCNKRYLFILSIQ